jgi:hypothetical protein
MQRSMMRPATRLFAGMLAVCLTLAASGCHGQTSASATSSPPPANGAPGTGSTLGSLTLPTEPPNDAPDTNPPMDPALAAMFSPEAKAGGQVGKPVDPHSLTPTELQFGRAPKLGPEVTYQPDAIVMEHGDTAIRSMDSNGMVWHFKADAPQVDQIVPGKVLFATDRCFGRVGAVNRNGDDVAVVLEPAQITDAIQRGHFVYDQPLDVTSLEVVPVPDVPVAFSVTKPGSTSSPSPGASPTATTSYVTRHMHIAAVTYAVVTDAGVWKPFRRVTYDARGGVHQRFLQPTIDRVAQAAPPAGGLPGGNPIPVGIPAPQVVSAPPPPTVNVDGMAATLCLKSCGGLGIELEYDKNGLKIYAYSTFYLHSPHIDFNVDINSSGIQLAAISLGGVAGFETQFTAADNQSEVVNIHVMQPLPLDTVVPINFIAPIGIHLSTSLNLDSGFSAKTGYLSGKIDFQMGRFLAVGYDRSRGGWFHDFPTIDVNSPYANVSGVSVGINSLIFGMSQKLLVGLGVAGFATGPYVALTEEMGSVKQSSVVMVDCRMASLTMQLDAGVGWSIPPLVAKVVNFFLTLANAKPIASYGSLIKMDPQKMLIYKGSLPKDCA